MDETTVTTMKAAIAAAVATMTALWGWFGWLVIAWVLLVFMVFDIVISSAAIRRQTNRHLGIPANNPIAVFLDEHYTDEYLKKVYPNMQLA